MSLKDQCPNDLGIDSPAQPVNVTYPIKVVRGANKKFCSVWFTYYDWLEYSVSCNKAFCFPCRNFLKDKPARNGAFTTKGFDNWGAAMEKGKGLKQHDGSMTHKEAMTAWEGFTDRQKKQTGINKLLNEKVVSDKRYYLEAIFDCIKFLVKHGMAFRGDKETIGSLHDPTEELTQGKFIDILEHTISRDKRLKQIAGTIPMNAKYTSPQIQNEAIAILKQLVQRRVVNDVRSSDAQCFCVKCDGTRDKNNIENICIVLQYVIDGNIEQRLLDIVSIEELDANSITDSIVGTLEQCNLPLDMIVSQCYDGASVMSGVRGGVQQLLREKVGRDIPYIHCFNHQLHLVVVNALLHEKQIGQFFEICGALYVFMRRQAVATMYDGDSLKRLLDNRWSGHLDTVRVLKLNFEEITLLLLDISISNDLAGDVVAIASGLLHKIIAPNFQFLIDLMYKVLSTLEPLNRQLQAKDRDLATAAALVTSTRAQIAHLRSDQQFKEIQVTDVDSLVPEIAGSVAAGSVEAGPWQGQRHQWCGSQKKRRRRLPARLKDSIITAPLPQISTVADQKQIYFSVIDSVEAELRFRFSEMRKDAAVAVGTFFSDDPNFLVVNKMEPLANAYSEYIDMDAVEDEAKIARRLFQANPDTSFYDHRVSLQLLFRLWAISKTVGASTASCENVFSALTRILTAYRRSRTHGRLSALVSLCFEKTLCDEITFDEFLVEFRKAPGDC